MVIYIKDHGVVNGKDTMRICAKYAIATWRKPEHDIRPTASQELMYNQVKGSYGRRPSSTIGLPGSILNYDTNGFQNHTAPTDGSDQSFVSKYLQPSIRYHSQYTTLLVPWRMTYVRLYAKGTYLVTHDIWRLYNSECRAQYTCGTLKAIWETRHTARRVW